MRCGDKLKQYRLAVINCVVALCVCSALLAGFSIKPAVSAEGLKCPAVEVPRNTRTVSYTHLTLPTNREV